ncbi:MAG: hypothetical protein QOF98_3142, partial [Streptomyces sp.]|nr:hypothetical protein [Streptomyces sp.]
RRIKKIAEAIQNSQLSKKEDDHG